MMFRLTSEPIEGPLLQPDQAVGAIVTFIGRVRDLNEGRNVLNLEYEAFPELAEKEGEEILQTAISRYPIQAAACVHRTGTLNLEEVAIRVEVASAHRKEAFEACAQIVDLIKARVPIWKKEHYEGGDSGWINCQMAGLQESDYYARQIRLPEIGPEGQDKLKAAKVLVVGAGGLGCPALMYLAGAGVGTIGICEPDDLDASNLHRQVLFDATELGKPKVRAAAEKLRRLNPFVQVQTHEAPLTPANAESICTGYDLLLDCTDNFDTKFLLNDTAVRNGKTLIYASIYQYEGQLFCYEPGGPCLRCLWPEKPPGGCIGNCAEAGVLGYISGVFGTLQAGEAIKRILGLSNEPTGSLVLIDLVDLSLNRIALQRDPACPVCGSTPLETQPWWEIFPETRDALQGYTLIDVREESELEREPLPIVADLWAPMSANPPESLLDMAGGNLLLVCRSGTRTAVIAQWLAERGETRVYSLGGGLRTLRELCRK